LNQFPNEAACRSYLMQIRWPDGPICPRCDGRQFRAMTRPLVRCRACNHHLSVLAGTVFQDSKIPLRMWFQAIWWFTNQKSGISATGLQRALGLKRNATAWSILHKIRLAMVRPGQDRLSGEVEVDEFFLGGENNKQLIGIAAEKDGRKTGRIRLGIIADQTGPTLKSFVKQHVEPNSTVVTDGGGGYHGLKKHGYIHKPMGPAEREGKKKEADELLPRVHRVVALLKRWYYGTYQGRMDLKYLDAYLNEFTFRFNRRQSSSRGLLFYRILENGVRIAPVPHLPQTRNL
jgi:transposase-like protein